MMYQTHVETTQPSNAQHGKFSPLQADAKLSPTIKPQLTEAS
jgi:hypothetical protein